MVSEVRLRDCYDYFSVQWVHAVRRRIYYYIIKHVTSILPISNCSGDSRVCNFCTIANSYIWVNKPFGALLRFSNRKYFGWTISNRHFFFRCARQETNKEQNKSHSLTRECSKLIFLYLFQYFNIVFSFFQERLNIKPCAVYFIFTDMVMADKS